MGRKQVSAEILEIICKYEDVNIVGVLTDCHLKQSPTKKIADKLGLKTYTFESALSEMNSGNLVFDLGLSVLYWRKLKGKFLSLPSLGIVNFHPAILPEYKGTCGYNLAILEGLSEWGVSAHYVDENIDTGEIIEVTKFSIDPENETALSLERKSVKILKKMVVGIFDRCIGSKNLLKTSSNTGGRYVSRLEMNSMKKIKDGDNIPRKIRAFWFPPYDGAYIEIDGEKYTLVNNKILKQLSREGVICYPCDL